MHPQRSSARNGTRSTFQPLFSLSYDLGSDRHAIALIEESGVDVGLTGVAETMVAPGRAPAIAHDETFVRGVADNGDGVSATDGGGLEGVQLPWSRWRDPSCIHTEAGQESGPWVASRCASH